MTSSLSTAVPVVLALALLSGCPTRPAPGLTPDLAPDAGSSAPAIDAGDDTSAPAITSTDGAVVDTSDAVAVAADGGVDADTLDPTGGGGAEQQKLPAPAVLTTGASCSVNIQCATGSCVDGVCCSSAACGTCQSCALAASLGTCSPLPAQTEDPRSSCVGTMACDGKGGCAAFNGNSCGSAGDCISGFCVDGVCCESSCDQTCYSCNTVLQLRGKCVALNGGPDPSAAAPCAGARSCAPGTTPEQPLCLLIDGQPCSAPTDCLSGQCSTFFADRDGDKFGNPLSSISICGAPDAAPPSYVAVAGDCCDADGNAHPNQFTSFAHTDACGSWDYNCDGFLEKQFTSGPCGGYPAGTPSDCGKACIGVVLGSPLTRYTQACR
jgi:hypothetical protein